MTLTTRLPFLTFAFVLRFAVFFSLYCVICGLFMAVSDANPQAPNIQLATEFSKEKSVHIKDFLVSEKLDGVRGYWDGKRLVTRQGNPILAPSWFTADFPTTPMDGELWLGRGRFEAISGLIRQASANESEWQNVRFMVFDLPKAQGSFAVRYQQMQTLLAGKSVYLQVIEQVSVESIEALYQKLDTLVAQGGEGLILHRRTALYTPGRNPNVMKLKPYLDAEAKVIGHIAGKGQFAGQLGALRVQTADGRVFSIGTGFSLAERQHPPAIGTLITYKYLGLTVNGLPRFASFLRVRSDMPQEDKE
ncbi:DNA ligase [Shewanella sp. 10B]|uniref:DNA ligase n=1 Tax=Shewanella sp. 10B TaxID=2943322 RepID=UPI00201A8EB2|nr:DNA ligase [Shewanella sp. 10B]